MMRATPSLLVVLTSRHIVRATTNHKRGLRLGAIFFLFLFRFCQSLRVVVLVRDEHHIIMEVQLNTVE